MPVDYASLAPGQEVSRQSCVMDMETVSRYVDAVGDETFDSPTMRGDHHAYVPAMAVAAISMRGVVNDLQIPGGTLHLGQELDFLDIVPINETLTCSAVLSQNSVRGGQRILVVALSVVGEGGRKVMSGKSTIAVPA